MIAVIYDPKTGEISQTVRGPASNMSAIGPAYLEVDAYREDYDVTYTVVAGTLTVKASLAS